MPLFEYVCEKCNKRTEILVRGDDAPKCPHCGSERLIKQASAFAPMGASSAPRIPAGCESCCSRRDGSCPRM